jgi:hypothetical protein
MHLDLTPQQLRHAADIQEKILALQHELGQLLGSDSQSGVDAPVKRKRISAQGLANIRAGARKRWGKVKGNDGTVGMPHKPRGKMSAAGRKRIAAALKARWAAAKKAGRNAL